MSGNSPDPGVPQSGTKAYVAAALAFATSFVGIWVADTDPFTSKEIAQAIVTGLIASGIVGIPTYSVKNSTKV